MASACWTRLYNKAVTFIRHLLASVFTSYSSPICICLEALACSPLNFTFPLSHAPVAIVLVLNRRMAHRYLSRRSFSLSGIHKIKIIFQVRILGLDKESTLNAFLHLCKIFMKIRNGFDALIEILQVKFFIR